MKTIRRKLDEIGGIDLGSSEKNVLKGGAYDYPYCFCIDDEGLTHVYGLCGLPTIDDCKQAAQNLYPDFTCFCVGID
jgi:hypothetical protein